MELTILCKELNNWFDIDRKFGIFTIENGKLTDDVELQENQYFRIVGSVFNDGVYKNDSEIELIDESFDGAIWAMAIPPEVIALCKKITAWEAQYGDAILSPYTSESFGGYSYSRGSNSNGGNALNGFREVFASDLNLWRKA